MAEFTVNTRDLTNSSFTWEALVKKFDSEGKEKNYEIVDGNMVTPIVTEYKLQIYKVQVLSSATIADFFDNKITISEETPEDFYRAISENKQLLISYVEWVYGKQDLYKSLGEMTLEDKLLFLGNSTKKYTKIRPFITDHIELNEAFRPNDWIVIDESPVNDIRIIEILDTHPDYQLVVEGIKMREEEMRRIIIESQKRDNETVRRNNYEMWKVLNQKFANGEFDDYVIEPRDYDHC